MKRSEVRELRNLPPEVRRLVHAVDRMRDHWAEAGPIGQHELWRRVHEANDGVWDRPLGRQRLASRLRIRWAERWLVTR